MENWAALMCSCLELGIDLYYINFRGFSFSSVFAFLFGGFRYHDCLTLSFLMSFHKVCSNPCGPQLNLGLRLGVASLSI